jgi:hypothetical protein
MKGDESLVLSSNLKGLPVQVDEPWKHHIGLITEKAQKILNLLRRHLNGCNPGVKKRAFTSLVLPHLEYTSTVWDSYHKQDIQALEKVQRKGARFVKGKCSCQDSVTARLKRSKCSYLNTWVTTIKVSSKQVEDLLSFLSYKSNVVFPC